MGLYLLSTRRKRRHRSLRKLIPTPSVELRVSEFKMSYFFILLYISVTLTTFRTTVCNLTVLSVLLPFTTCFQNVTDLFNFSINSNGY